MIGFYSVILLATLQIITAQEHNIPKHCQHPPKNVNPSECCPIPPAYTDEETEACGFSKSGEEPPSRRKHHHKQGGDCTKSMCLLRNTDQLNEDDTINYHAVAKKADKWAKAHPDFKEAILLAKEKCLKDNRAPPGPPEVCDADKIVHCMSFNIIWNCNLKEDLPQCQTFKEHIDECRQYYDL